MAHNKAEYLDKPEPVRSEVDEQFYQAFAAVDELTKVVKELETRLAPVLQPAPASDSREGSDEKEDSCELSPVANEIRNINVSMSLVKNRVKDILNYLAV